MHKFRKCILPAVLIVFLSANALLSHILYPYTYTRAMFREMQTADYDTLIVGGSHSKCGIDPSVLKSEKGVLALNAAQGGEHTLDMYYLVREAEKDVHLKYVICEIDPSYWVDEPNQTQEYVALYHEFPWSAVKIGYFYDKMLRADFRTAPFEWYLYRQQVAHLPELIREKKSEEYRNFDISCFTDEVQSYHRDGFIARFRVDAGTTREDVPALWNRGNYNKDEQKYFEKLAEFCEKSGIELVTVITPIPDTTYEAYRDAYDDASAFFEEYMAKRGIRMINYLRDGRNTGQSDDAAIGNTAGRVPRDPDDFCDNEGHMFEDTAAEFTKVLAEDFIG